MKKVFVIAEVGINHNGDLSLAKKLIDAAAFFGYDAVKFQKRNPDICVPEHQKTIMRDTPWGEMTYLDYKYRLEFGKDEYNQIDAHCKEKGIKWFASVWDIDSADFMVQYTNIAKIPSALITDKELTQYTREKFNKLIISTGMSTEEEVEECVSTCNPDVIMHTNSTYPSPINELNLNYIYWLENKYKKEVGYSGHEYGLVTTYAAVAMGATWVERHVTLDRTMWGSDHAASVELDGMAKLIKGIRGIESSLGINGPRKVMGSELSKRKSLRGE